MHSFRNKCLEILQEKLKIYETVCTEILAMLLYSVGTNKIVSKQHIKEHIYENLKPLSEAERVANTDCEKALAISLPHFKRE